MQVFCRRQGTVLTVNPAVHISACNGIGALLPLALDSFEIGETRTIDVFVHHARR